MNLLWTDLLVKEKLWVKLRFTGELFNVYVFFSMYLDGIRIPPLSSLWDIYLWFPRRHFSVFIHSNHSSRRRRTINFTLYNIQLNPIIRKHWKFFLKPTEYWYMECCRYLPLVSPSPLLGIHTFKPFQSEEGNHQLYFI